MSGAGYYPDNGAAEGVFGLFNRDRVCRRRYLTQVQARSDLSNHIKRFRSPRIGRGLINQ